MEISFSKNRIKSLKAPLYYIIVFDIYGCQQPAGGMYCFNSELVAITAGGRRTSSNYREEIEEDSIELR